jgi:hypothetical protein
MTAAFSPASQTLAKPGTVTFTLMVHNTGNSEDAYTATIVGTNGPVSANLIDLAGSRAESTVVLTFDQALDAITAVNPRNYQIIAPGGRKVRVKSAVYDPASRTVALDPSQRINIHHRYILIVDGASAGSITNAAGQFLNSKAEDPGSNYRTSLTWRNLVLDPPWPKAARPAKTPSRRR